MAYINTAPTAALEPTYNALIKYVKQYITSGHLKSKFDVFEREEVKQGAGVETNIILAATNKRTDAGIDGKIAEHAIYKPKVVTIIATAHSPKQYPVTVNEDRIALCVNDDAKIREYAAELTQSLFQGWTDDKNAGVAAGLNEIIALTSPAPLQVTISADTQKYADDLLMNAKAAIENMREGVTGTSYGNTEIGTSKIAAESVVMLMSNATAAMLDTYGYSKAFNENYLSVGDVHRVTSSFIPENTILITDARNVVLHKRNESLVTIPNSDGSHNLFYNVDYFIDLAASEDTEGAVDEIGFPFKVIKGVEASVG